jgi:2-methylcitrate dehydratase
VKLFHTDSVLCGISALALKTNAPTVLQKEALSKSVSNDTNKPNLGYAKVFGSSKWVPAENAICANSSAVREWDSNGTVFGYNPKVPGH